MNTMSTESNTTYWFNLTKIQGRPTPAACCLLKREAAGKVHAISHPKTGLGGYLGSILGAEEFRSRTGHDWVEPKLPKEPTTRGTNYAVEYQRYLEHKRTYTEYTRILAALRTQILEAIDEAYLADIPNADAEYGMDSLPPKVILDYVCTQYGRMTNAEYEANKRMLLEVADPTKPIAEMFLRVRDICNTAQLGGPNQRITEESKVHHVRESLVNKGRTPT
jgi:hypothetical protein